MTLARKPPGRALLWTIEEQASASGVAMVIAVSGAAMGSNNSGSRRRQANGIHRLARRGFSWCAKRFRCVAQCRRRRPQPPRRRRLPNNFVADRHRKLGTLPYLLAAMAHRYLTGEGRLTLTG
jgi:hypothetical protein